MKILCGCTAALIAVLTLGGCSDNTEPAQNDTQAQNDALAQDDTDDTAESVWMTDFEAAKAKADQEGKDLLMDFSGSDWCYWCQRLDEEVFSRQGFIDEAGRDFVFVKIDFPSDKSGQSQALQQQNDRLARNYGIQGYPTIILARPDGTEYARTVYREGGPDAYLDHLQQLRQER